MYSIPSMLFPYAATQDAYMIAMGLIWSLALGFTAGNYACSLVHRLPRGLGILEKKPYCGSCQTMLATRDLFPVVSAMLLRYRCRYCDAAIPKSHFYTEILIGILFCLCFLIFGFSEQYFLLALLGSMLVVLASIHTNNGILDWRVRAACAATAMIHRTLVDGSIYGFFAGGMLGLMLGILIWRKHFEPHGHVFVIPLPAMLLAAGGVIVGLKGMLFFLPIFTVLALTFKTFPTRLPLTVPFGLSVMLVLLFSYQ